MKESIIAILAVTSIIALLTSSMSVQTSGCGPDLPASRMIRIVEGTPYTVPQGFSFVLTGMGEVDFATLQAGEYGPTLVIDGSPVIHSSLYFGGVSSTAAVIDIPPGIAAPEGSSVSVIDYNTGLTATAWGYLDER